MQTLVLSAGMQPLRVTGWEDAISLVFKGNAEVLEVYEDQIARLPIELVDNHRSFLQSLHRSVEDAVDGMIQIMMPAVIRLVKVFKRAKKKAKFSRINVFCRDHFKCQYCGFKCTPASAFKHLTYDHVVPRSQGGRTNWSNIVTACKKCNGTKANRTPEQAGMRLLSTPIQPKNLPITFHLRYRNAMPEMWKQYLEWAGILDTSTPT